MTQAETYLCSTTREGRLNHLMLLHVHKELADGNDIVEVANLFVGVNQRRKSTFASKATQTVNNYELTMMTLKGETFAGFKIQR